MSEVWNTCVTCILWLAIVFITGTNAKCPACPEGAKCKHHVCVCPKGTVGDPEYHCYDPSESYFCTIYNDSVLSTYRRKSIDAYLPASVALSDVQTNRNSKKPGVTRGEVCSLKLSTWTSKEGGKFVLRGVEFEYKQKTYLRGEKLALGRILATVVPGGGTATSSAKPTYKWEVFFYRPERNIFSRVATIQTDGKKQFQRKIAKCVTLFQRDDSDFLTVTFDCCNQTIGFRPYNSYAPEKVAGLWVKVRRQELSSLGFPWYVCGTPEGSSSIDRFVKRHGYSSHSAAVAMTALQHVSLKEYKDAPKRLEDVKELFSQKCPKGEPAIFYSQTEFLFSDSKLLHNIASLDRLFNLIYDLGRTFCYRDKRSFRRCIKAAHVIRARTSEDDDTPSLRKFLKDGCRQFKAFHPL